MHAQFPGSGLLVWNNSGVGPLLPCLTLNDTDLSLQHCAHFQKSACVSKYERQYMLDGTLPPAGATCEVDEPSPFLILAEMLKDANDTLSK
jgi:hypothetical protein